MLPLTRKSNSESFDGKICAGLGAARGNLAAQLPLIAREYPEIKDCYCGTINIEMTRPTGLLDADYRTGPITWMANVTETFSFTKILFEYPLGAATRAGWIYRPQSSPHRGNDYFVEIVTERIEGLKVGAPCRFRLLKFGAF